MRRVRKIMQNLYRNAAHKYDVEGVCARARNCISKNKLSHFYYVRTNTHTNTHISRLAPSKSERVRNTHTYTNTHTCDVVAEQYARSRNSMGEFGDRDLVGWLGNFMASTPSDWCRCGFMSPLPWWCMLKTNSPYIVAFMRLCAVSVSVCYTYACVVCVCALANGSPINKVSLCVCVAVCPCHNVEHAWI